MRRSAASSDGGVTRVAWSPELFAAYAWVGDRLRELGLEVEIDAAGNLLARWSAGSGSPVLVGSHLDTVPSGGRFDGVLGVVSALHAVRTLKAEGFEPARPLWIVAFMDEEGTRFDAALFGSRAFAGEDVTGLGERVDANGVTTCARRWPPQATTSTRAGDADRVAEVGAYLELHIEQGPVLEAAGIEIGVVTSIVGLRGYRVRLTGQANHAGTTPMALRRDALAGAARIALELREAARSREAVTANVGKLTVAPGGANVVPGLADFTIDVRATTGAGLAELEQHRRGDGGARLPPRRVSRSTCSRPSRSSRSSSTRCSSTSSLARPPTEGASSLRMPSGAGHDAMLVGRRAPAAMIFVPSRGGISHSPDEYSSPAHVELGVRVLASALRELLGKEVR